MKMLKNWKVKSPKIVELVLLVLMIAGLCTQNPLLAQPVKNISDSKTTPNSIQSTSAFISTWNTSLSSSGSSNSTQIELPLISTGTYNFMVDWGENLINSTITSYSQGIAPHNYTNAGVYTLTITGVISGWEFNNGGDVLKITDISQWGPLNLGNTGNYFYGASNLDITATDPLNLTGTTNLAGAFESCSNLGNSGTGYFNGWNTSAVTSMSNLFRGSSFNQPISNWNVLNVQYMDSMYYADAVFNQNISTWDVSHVTTMTQMFLLASAFNQPIGSWNVSSVIDMSSMFFSAFSFNQNISTWDVSHVTTMNSMFDQAKAFNQPINNWNVASVTDMSSMFSSAGSFNQPLDKWNVSHVQHMDSMFSSAYAFNQPIGNWNLSSVTSINGMFSTANSFNQPIGNWSFPLVTSLSDMFNGNNVFNQNISSWNVGNVTTMVQIFAFSHFNQPIGNWNVSSVTDMSGMFQGNTAFNQSIGNWNVTSVTDMAHMFDGDTAFNQSIGNWSVSNVIDMSYMFSQAYAFNQPLGTWNVSSVMAISGPSKSMTSMFYEDTLSYQNYDNLLIGWSKLPNLQFGVAFDAGNSQYSYKAVNARQSLKTNFGWIITDGGEYNLTAPQSVQAFSGNRSILLTWSAPSSNGGSAITNYLIYRSTTSGTGFTLINTVSPSTFSYNNTNLLVQQTYYYIVSAINGIGNTTNSTQVSALTNSVPSSPQFLTAQAGYSSVLLSWSTPITNGGSAITNYNIYISTDGGASYSFVTSVGPSTFSYNITGLTNGIQYYFEVNATNSAGIGLSTAVFAIPFTIPTSPQSVTTTPGNGFVVLSWQGPIFTGGSAITSYNIYDSTNGGTSYSLLASVGGSTYFYNDTGLVNGQTYYFVVTAVNKAGESPYSTPVSAASTSTVPTLSTAPQSLTAQAGYSSVLLSWSAPSSDGGSSITGFNVYISSDGGSSYSPVTSVGASTYSYNETGLNNGQIYYFVVTATNGVGESAYSTPVSVTPTVSINSSTSVSLNTSTTATSTSTTSTTSTTSITVTSTSSKSTTTITATTDGFIFILPIISMIVIYFKRQKKN